MAINTQPLSNIANLIAQKSQADANRQERQFQTGVQIAQSGLARRDAQQAAEQKAQQEQQELQQQQEQFGQQQAVREGQLELDQEGQENLQAFRAAQQATDLAKLDAATVEKAIDHAADISASLLTVPTDQFNQALAQAGPQLMKAFPSLEGRITPDMSQAEFAGLAATFGVKSPKELTPQEKGQSLPAGFTLDEKGNMVAIPGSPASRLSGEATKLITIATSGQRMVDKMSEVLGGMGDIDILKAELPNVLKTEDGQLFSFYRSQITDQIGRLRSGGAITEDELKTFRKFIPELGDKPRVRQAKIGELTNIFKSIETNILGTETGVSKVETSGVDTSKPDLSIENLSDDDILNLSDEEIDKLIAAAEGK